PMREENFSLCKTIHLFDIHAAAMLRGCPGGGFYALNASIAFIIRHFPGKVNQGPGKPPCLLVCFFSRRLFHPLSQYTENSRIE
ncbi:MAG TPA: hypothetical protein H9736_09350, partial [Candidatus Anaerotruncus excrementipullorum]|nr:hypothetical protein [Candidatus Anaerotruncus excrementipullorum]